ncbi:MAG: NAD(P)-dependent oxidoreductase [Burkholderiales bacterium]
MPRTAAVCNVYEHEIGIAEYVLAAMLHFTVQIPRLDAALKRGEWWGSHLCGPRHGELHGQTLGIIGYGRIGRETARRAKAFGMRVAVCNRSARDPDGLVDEVRPMSHLHALLAESDFVLLALPLESTTHSLIGARELARMKPTGHHQRRSRRLDRGRRAVRSLPRQAHRRGGDRHLVSLPARG